MAKTREIKRTITSIRATSQVTKAMELVAASKMRKAVENTLASRFYAETARYILFNVSQVGADLSPLLKRTRNGKYLCVVISTNRGLCGGLNTKLFHKIINYKLEQDKKTNPPQISFIAVGRKAEQFLSRTGANIIASFSAMSNHSELKDIYPLSKLIIDEYTDGHYEKILVFYTDFINALSQKPVLRRLLPLSRPALEEIIEGIDPHGKKEDSVKNEQKTDYLFEPSPTKILHDLLLRLTEMQIYQAVLEAAASEHSARMFAMRNAYDNSQEIIQELTLTLNKARQAIITQEIAEISAGMAALSD